jgi:WbqC-like protein family
MKLAIMQPYLFPYIGYFQLMNAVDEFVVYDNIEFTKKGWINRNRILVNGKDDYITVPLKKGSDYLNINDRYLAEIWSSEKNKVLNKIRNSYQKSTNFDIVFTMIEEIILYENNNLFGYILNSLNLLKEYLGIRTSIIASSTIPIDHTLRAEKKVIEICKIRSAKTYINSIGGIHLYSKDVFKAQGIDLLFLKVDEITYPQFGNKFIPCLSILDVIMFNTKDQARNFLNKFITE